MSFSNSPKVRPKHFYYERLSSTQDQAAALLDVGEVPPFYVSAAEQTQGRGRMQRSWTSEPGRSLMMTLVYRSSSAYISGFSLVVGIAIVRALQRDDLQIKWPNDIMRGESKLGGILIESRSQGALVDYLIGIGLNLFNLQQSPYQGLNQSPSVEEIGDAVLAQLEIFSRDGFGQFREEFHRRMWKRGEEVLYSYQSQSRKVKALGVNDEGALLIEEGGELRLGVDGEILYGH